MPLHLVLWPDEYHLLTSEVQLQLDTVGATQAL